jgi:hypothetical protein
MATTAYKSTPGGQTGQMVSQHKNMAQGGSPDTGAGGLPSVLGGRPPRVNPNRNISHSPLSDASRACGPPRGNTEAGVPCQCDPNHGPFV